MVVSNISKLSDWLSLLAFLHFSMGPVITTLQAQVIRTLIFQCLGFYFLQLTNFFFKLEIYVSGTSAITWRD